MRRTVDDGYGEVECCSRIDCDLEVVRPGKVQCRGEYDSLGCPHTEEELVKTMNKAIKNILKAFCNE
jgi:hypothetical protein